MPKSGAERTKAWRERNRSGIIKTNTKRKKTRTEIERDSRERSRARAKLLRASAVDNMENQPTTTTMNFYAIKKCTALTRTDIKSQPTKPPRKTRAEVNKAYYERKKLLRSLKPAVVGDTTSEHRTIVQPTTSASFVRSPTHVQEVRAANANDAPIVASSVHDESDGNIRKEIIIATKPYVDEFQESTAKTDVRLKAKKAKLAENSRKYRQNKRISQTSKPAPKTRAEINKAYYDRKKLLKIIEATTLSSKQPKFEQSTTLASSVLSPVDSAEHIDNLVQVNYEHSISCRACGKAINNGKALNLFAEKECNTKENIKKLTGVSLINKVGFPSCICNSCQLRLTQAIQFRECCIAVQQKFLPRLSSNKESDNDVSKLNDTKPAYDPLEIENKIETEPDVDSTKPANNPLEIDNSQLKKIKLEAELDIDDESFEDFSNSSKPPKIEYSQTRQVNVKVEVHIQEDEFFEDFSNSTKPPDNHLQSRDSQSSESIVQPEKDKQKDESFQDFNKSADESMDYEDYEEDVDYELQSDNDEAVSELSTKQKHNFPIKSKQKAKKLSKLSSGEQFDSSCICDQCGQHFSNNRNLRLHLIRHTGNKVFECKQCDRKFYTAGLLKMHEHKHANRFKCSYCDETFAYNSSRKRHELMHSEERPFQCQYCDKSFINSSLLKDHGRKHTNPFKCSYCDETFGYKRSLKRHEAMHRNERPFQCQHCDKSFIDAARMKRHESVHLRISSYKCNVCGVCFMSSKNLKLHCRTKSHIQTEMNGLSEGIDKKT